MPVITSPVVEDGAVIDLWVGVNGPRRDILLKNNFPVPAPISIKAQIDTGSSLSAVDPAVLQRLDIRPVDRIGIRTPVAALELHYLDLYVVSLSIRAEGLEKLLDSVQVLGSCFAPEEEIHAFIGRDVLAHCKFNYDGPSGSFVLIFDSASVSHFPRA